MRPAPVTLTPGLPRGRPEHRLCVGHTRREEFSLSAHRYPLRFPEFRPFACSGARVAVHDKTADHGGHRHDRQRDERERAVGDGLPGLAQLDERDDEGEGPQERDRHVTQGRERVPGGGAT